MGCGNVLMEARIGWRVVSRLATIAWAPATSFLARISSSATGAGAGAAKTPVKELARARREMNEVFMVVDEGWLSVLRCLGVRLR